MIAAATIDFLARYPHMGSRPLLGWGNWMQWIGAGHFTGVLPRMNSAGMHGEAINQSENVLFITKPEACSPLSTARQARLSRTHFSNRWSFLLFTPLTAMARKEDLIDEQWAILVPLVPETPRRLPVRGKSREQTDRAIVNSILWVLRTGDAWVKLPPRFPPARVCFRCFSRWLATGALRAMLEALANHLEEAGRIDLAHCFSDGTFLVARKDEQQWERPDAAAMRNAWELMTLAVFHSPCTRLLLDYMHSPLSQLPSLKPTLWDTPTVLSGIVPASMERAIEQAHHAA